MLSAIGDLPLGLSGPCPTYDWQANVNAGHITTFSQHSIISESRLTPIDAKYGHEVSALMADTITTGFGVISNDAKVRIGQSVVSSGLEESDSAALEPTGGGQPHRRLGLVRP